MACNLSHTRHHGRHIKERKRAQTELDDKANGLSKTLNLDKKQETDKARIEAPVRKRSITMTEACQKDVRNRSLDIVREADPHRHRSDSADSRHVSRRQSGLTWGQLRQRWHPGTIQQGRDERMHELMPEAAEAGRPAAPRQRSNTAIDGERRGSLCPERTTWRQLSLRWNSLTGLPNLLTADAGLSLSALLPIEFSSTSRIDEQNEIEDYHEHLPRKPSVARSLSRH